MDAFGEVANPADFPLGEEDELVGVVPGEWVTAHKVSLPAKNKRQFQAALPYALEEAVSEEIEHLHFSCSNWRAGEEVVVHVVANDKLSDWQQLANDSKLPLDRLVPDYALLPFHEAAESTIALANSSSPDQLQVIAHRKNGYGACLDSDFVEAWLIDLPIKETVAVTDRDFAEKLIADYPDRDFRLWEAGNKIAHWLEYPEADPTLDILTDKYRPSVRRFEWSGFYVPIGIATAAVFVFLLFDVYRYFALHHEIREVLDEQAMVLQKSFPEITDVPDNQARALMERALTNRVGKPQQHNATSLIAATAQVLHREKVSLSEVVFRDGQLTITCVLSDLSQVDKITRQLNSRPQVSALLESSANEDGQILASYTLRAS